jgi:hypothetical protein
MDLVILFSLISISVLLLGIYVYNQDRKKHP